MFQSSLRTAPPNGAIPAAREEPARPAAPTAGSAEPETANRLGHALERLPATSEAADVVQRMPKPVRKRRRMRTRPASPEAEPAAAAAAAPPAVAPAPAPTAAADLTAGGDDDDVPDLIPAEQADALRLALAAHRPRSDGGGGGGGMGFGADVGATAAPGAATAAAPAEDDDDAPGGDEAPTAAAAAAPLAAAAVRRPNKRKAPRPGRHHLSDSDSDRSDRDDPDVVFRALRPEENPYETGLLPPAGHDPNVTVSQHVGAGTSAKVKSGFVSTSRSRSRTAAWASESGRGGRRVAKVRIPKHLRESGAVVDLNDEVQRGSHGLGDTAANFAKRSKEVLIRGGVSKEDILDLYEASRVTVAERKRLQEARDRGEAPEVVALPRTRKLAKDQSPHPRVLRRLPRPPAAAAAAAASGTAAAVSLAASASASSSTVSGMAAPLTAPPPPSLAHALLAAAPSSSVAAYTGRGGPPPPPASTLLAAASGSRPPGLGPAVLPAPPPATSPPKPAAQDEIEPEG